MLVKHQNIQRNNVWTRGCRRPQKDICGQSWLSCGATRHASSGPLWSFVVLCSPLWSFEVLWGPLRSFVVLCGPLWSFVVLWGPLWSFEVLCGPLRSFCPARSASLVFPECPLRRRRSAKPNNRQNTKKNRGRATPFNFLPSLFPIQAFHRTPLRRTPTPPPSPRCFAQAANRCWAPDRETRAPPTQVTSALS